MMIFTVYYYKHILLLFISLKETANLWMLSIFAKTQKNFRMKSNLLFKNAMFLKYFCFYTISKHWGSAILITVA